MHRLAQMCRCQRDADERKGSQTKSHVAYIPKKYSHFVFGIVHRSSHVRLRLESSARLQNCLATGRRPIAHLLAAVLFGITSPAII
jgi:hypothetical protein